jgi:hypothetical protein
MPAFLPRIGFNGQICKQPEWDGFWVQCGTTLGNVVMPPSHKDGYRGATKVYFLRDSFLLPG